MFTQTPVILGSNGQPARLPKNAVCPRCGAPADRRVPESGFGENPKEICGVCGFEEF